MDSTIAIIFTLILLAGFVFALVKKFQPIIALLLLSVLGCLVFTIATGTSVLGPEKTTGNIIIDCFEFFQTTMTSQMGGALLTILAVLGYVGYMKHLGASDRFALICAKPFMRLKNPYILCSGVILLVFFLKLAIPSATSLAALMLATMYPILRKAGVTALTAGSCIMISTGFIWGPADTMSAQIFSVSGVSTLTVPEFFAAYHIPAMAVMVPFAMIAFPIYSTICDKRAAAKALAKGGSVSEGNLESKVEVAVQCPAYYAILPILPLVFVLVFSKLIVGTIVVSVIGAVFMSILVSMVVDLIHVRKLTKMADDAVEFFNAMAMFLRSGGWLIIPAGMFAATLNTVGGLQAIAGLLAAVGGNGVIITIVGCLLIAPIIICTGSVTATLAIAAPLMVSIANATGMDVFVCFMAALVTLGVASCMCPVHPQTIMVSTEVGVTIPQLIKRNAPIACMNIAAGLVGVFLFTM